jgi:hypothetical protein
VACCLDITLGSAGFTVACFCHSEFHCTILALANQHITFLDFHTLTSFKLEYRNTAKKHTIDGAKGSISGNIEYNGNRMLCKMKVLVVLSRVIFLSLASFAAPGEISQRKEVNWRTEGLQLKVSILSQKNQLTPT